jgi:putative PEP-CTERM system TPR-repeat lipoprotein
LSGLPLSSSAGDAEYYEQALQYFNSDDFESAHIELMNLLLENPDHLPGKILFGRLLLINRQYHIAITEFETVLDMGADLEHVLEPLGQALLYSRQYEAVLELGNNMQLSREVRIQRHLLRARAYTGLNAFPEAEQEYQQASLLAPDNVQVLDSRVAFYIRTDQIANAEKLLRKSRAINGENFRSWHLQGQIYKARDEPDKATKAYEKALELNPADTASKRALAHLAFDQGDNLRARQLIDQVLSDAPTDAVAMLLKARLLLMAEDSELAKQLLDEINNLISNVTDEFVADNPWVSFVSGVSNYLLGNYAQARVELEKYYNNNKDNFYAISILAQTYLKLERQRSALDLLDKHTELVLQDVDASVLLCELYLQANRKYRCGTLLADLENRYPDNEKIQLASARWLVSLGKYNEAIQRLQEANNKQQNEEIEGYLIRLYLETNQSGKALYLIRGLLPENNDNPDLLNVLATVLIQMGDYKKAERVLTRVFEINPHYYGAKYNLAAIRLASGQADDAKYLLEPLLYLQPGNEEVRILLARAEINLDNSDGAVTVLSGQPLTGNQNIKSREMLLTILQLSGEYQQALSIINGLLKNQPLAPDYLTKQAEIYIALKEPAKAQGQLELLYHKWIDEPDKLVQLAKLQYRADDMTGARKSIDRALEIAPELQAAQLGDIELSIKSHDVPGAEAKVSAIKSRTPGDTKVILIEAELQLLKRQFGQAQVIYARAFAMDMSNGMVLVKMYNLASLGYRPALFEKQIINALEQQPGNSYYRNLYADYLMLNRRFGEAREHYLIIRDIEDFPNRANLLNNLAISSMGDDLELASQSALEALQLKPNSASILDTYGWILANQEQYEEALDVLRKAQAISATDPSIRYHLGYTLYKIGRTREGIKEIEQAVTSERTFWGREDARKMLTSLQSQ